MIAVVHLASNSTRALVCSIVAEIPVSAIPAGREQCRRGHVARVQAAGLSVSMKAPPPSAALLSACHAMIGRPRSDWASELTANAIRPAASVTVAPSTWAAAVEPPNARVTVKLPAPRPVAVTLICSASTWMTNGVVAGKDVRSATGIEVAAAVTALVRVVVACAVVSMVTVRAAPRCHAASVASCTSSRPTASVGSVRASNEQATFRPLWPPADFGKIPLVHVSAANAGPIGISKAVSSAIPPPSWRGLAYACRPYFGMRRRFACRAFFGSPCIAAQTSAIPARSS